MKKIVIWFVLLAPALLWIALSFHESTWWVENIVAFPALFFMVYVSIALVLLACQQWGYGLSCLVVSGVFFLLTPKSAHVFVSNCVNPITVSQFNLYYENDNINGLINRLLSSPSDLVVLQEVSPEVGEKLKTLSDVYPFLYGGQEGIGYPSSQMILSRSPLEQMSVFMTPDEQAIIRGVWHPNKHRSMTLMIAHPTSPRTKALWYRRNAIIRTIASLEQLYPQDEVLIIGDFNLSSTSLRFAQLFPSFQTAPVSSWPNWATEFKTPDFSMIAIDHLWLKASQTGRKICERRSLSSPTGSDHKMVITKIGN